MGPLLRLLPLLALTLAISGVRGDSLDSVETSLRFPRERHVFEDTWSEFRAHDALKRWSKENGTIEHDPVNMEERSVRLESAAEKNFSVLQQGFELVTLHPRLLPILAEIERTGLTGARSGPQVIGVASVLSGGAQTEAIEDRLAYQLQGSDSFSLGKNGEYFHYAFRCAGFVIRKGGPEGAKLEGAGFDMVAHRVHIDQDLEGEPLRSFGISWIFKLPFMRLLNVWSPLTDVRMRPLGLADVETVNRERDVLRYRTNSTANAGGRFGSFVSDRLMSLYDARHKWYWYPRMRFGEAIAFDTGRVPHSSFTLPGERVLGELRNQIAELAGLSESENNQKKDLVCAPGYEERVELLRREEAARIPLDVESAIGAAVALKKRMCEGRSSPSDVEATLRFLSRASLEIRCVTMVVSRDTMSWIGTGVAGTAIALLAARRLRSRKRG